MARRSFKDRLLTPPVARAMVSPLGILLAGAGAALGIVTGLGPIAAVGFGAAAWAGRVFAAVPNDPKAERIDPFTINEPWRREVQDALGAQRQFREAVRDTRSGPLRERMQEIGSRIDAGVDEAWRIARQGQAMVDARRRIDVAQAQREYGRLHERAQQQPASDTAVRALQSVQAQLETAQRMDASIGEAIDRLHLTNAKLDEAVARAVELSVAAEDVSDLVGLGDEVDALVDDLEALRLGLEAVDEPRPGTA